MDSFSLATVTIYDLLVHLIAYSCLRLSYCYGSESGENIINNIFKQKVYFFSRSGWHSLSVQGDFILPFPRNLNTLRRNYFCLSFFVIVVLFIYSFFVFFFLVISCA